MLNQVFAACLMIAAQSYQVPPAVLYGIYQVEGGKVGQMVGPNKNGTYDLGPMQINTLWVPVLAKHWKISEQRAFRLIRDDSCTNVNVSAWILRTNLDETGSLGRAIAYYHSRTPSIGSNYKRKVISAMRRNGLIKKKDTAQENVALKTETKVADLHLKQ